MNSNDIRVTTTTSKSGTVWHVHVGQLLHVAKSEPQAQLAKTMVHSMFRTGAKADEISAAIQAHFHLERLQ